jgi:RNA polymerase sigma-70 factor (ECF subfamily)
MPTIQQATTFDFSATVPMMASTTLDRCRQAYEQNRHRIYAIAFWMTDNELAAEELMLQAFLSACSNCDTPGADEVDRALLHELRQCMSIGKLTLECQTVTRVLSVRRNTLRVDLERAVVQLPSTEKMIFVLHDVEQYPHGRVARLLGISEDESIHGLHQARLRLRELLVS